MGRLLPNLRTLMAALALGLMFAANGAARGEIDCTCRYAGQSYDQNACVCILTPNGARMACCEKVLNNTSWSFKGDGCPMASAPDGGSNQSFAEGRRAADKVSEWLAAAVGD
jgi:hypothetical protein